MVLRRPKLLVNPVQGLINRRLVFKKGLRSISNSFFKIILIPVCIIGFAILVLHVGISAFEANANIPSTDLETTSKIYSCTDYGDLIHCDPMLNALKSYVMHGHSATVYIPQEKLSLPPVNAGKL